MKTTRILLLTLLVLLAGRDVASAAAPSMGVGLQIGPSGGATVDLGFFYDDLAPYGYWVDRPAYGWAWAPRDVAPTWRPYMDGSWALTDRGWTWISDEPFGWATYHYGSWVLDPAFGWLWVPDNEWAPAWVSWREGNGYVGWAPRAPARVRLVPESWVFVPTSRFLEPQIVSYAVAPTEVVNIFSRTHTVTHYRIVNRQFFNQGLAVDRVQSWVGRPVPRYQLADLNPNVRHGGARIVGNRIALFRPKVAKAKVAPPPGRAIAAQAVMTPRAVADTVRSARASRATAFSSASPGALRHQERTERRRLAAQTVAKPDTGRRQKDRPGREVRQDRERPRVDRPLRSRATPEKREVRSHAGPGRTRHGAVDRPLRQPRETRLRQRQASPPRQRVRADQRPHQNRPSIRHEGSRPQQRLQAQRRAGRPGGKKGRGGP